MTSPAILFRDLMRSAPFQPATNLWRAVELDAVQRHGLPGGRALDLGCGDGKLTRIVDATPMPQGPARIWVGVDIDPEETALARLSGLYSVVHTTSATAIPEADGSFDLIFSNSVLEHIGPIEGVLAEAGRLLKPGGRLVLTVPGPGFHRALAGPLWGARNRAAYLREIDTRCAHLRYWGVQDWRQQLAQQGLDVVAHRGYLSVVQTRRWERLSALTGGLLYRLYGQQQRPIEIQRQLGMRRSQVGGLGRLMGMLAPALSWGCPLDGLPDDAGDSACLLIDAVRL